MAQDWDIKGRSEACAVTGRPFADGEYFYTLLFHDGGGFTRQDLSDEAWKERNDNIQPFSYWRARFEPVLTPAPEPLAKQTAEDLLRRYLHKDDAHFTNARYILALMLERKRVLKQIEAKETEEGRTLIYEHVKTGEVFVIPDPHLQLGELETVQNEVAMLLEAAA